MIFTNSPIPFVVAYSRKGRYPETRISAYLNSGGFSSVGKELKMYKN